MIADTNTDSAARQVVLSFIEALNKDDFKTARNYLTDDMKFEGVMGTRDGAEAYIADMERMKFKYTIKKVFTDSDDVCLFYNIDMGGITIFSCGWYQVVKGKVKSFRVIFDPRPLLEKGK
jgi:limonene-1,2-epoxide hydrolase